MRIDRRWFLAIAVLLLPLFLLVVAKARGDRDETKIRWDIIHIGAFSPRITVFEGGFASALANDGSMITLTGKGTFQPGDSEEVTGGGTWQTFSPPDATGVRTSTGNGTYRVRRLVRFDPAPGSQTTNVTDNIGNGTLNDNQAGLAYFRITYSDGSKGVLVVSCQLNGAPPSPRTVFEGLTASKGFADYWNRAPVVGGVDANRTLFHILPEEE
jgi:hypothetical protein